MTYDRHQGLGSCCLPRPLERILLSQGRDFASLDMLGITFKGARRIGDKLQFSSFPENWYRNTGERVIDLDRSWVFDDNPFVVREEQPDRVIDLLDAPWPGKERLQGNQYVRKPIYFSHAERTCSIFGHVAYLRHPRLYRYEDLPVLERRVVLHTTGANYPSGPPFYDMGEDRQRVLPSEIIEHIRSTYRDYELIQIGGREDLDARVIDRRGLDIWEAVKIIAQASIFIGVDSGPYWIAACYPGIFRKKILVQYPPDYLRCAFVPMHALNFHTHWHDAACLYYNRSNDDAGITYSYLKL
jgi:hypothetical protein